MPTFQSFEDFIGAIRAHTRLGGAHVTDLIPADSPPDIGYSCTACEDPGGRFILRVGLVRAARQRAVAQSEYDRLVTMFQTSAGRQHLAGALAAGSFDALPWVSGVARDPAAPPATRYPTGDLVGVARAMREGVVDTSPERQVPSRQAVLEPESAPPVDIQEYRLRPKYVQGFHVPTSGWYDVPGIGLSVLEAGFYIVQDDGSLVTRNPVLFNEQYEIVGREDPDLPVVLAPERFEREPVV